MSERFLTVAKPATVGRYYFLKHKLFEEKIQRKSFVTFQNLQREMCKLKAIKKYFSKSQRTCEFEVYTQTKKPQGRKNATNKLKRNSGRRAEHRCLFRLSKKRIL